MAIEQDIIRLSSRCKELNPDCGPDVSITYYEKDGFSLLVGNNVNEISMQEGSAIYDSGLHYSISACIEDIYFQMSGKAPYGD